MKNYALLDENNLVINISIADNDWDSTGWVDYTNKNCGIGFTYNEVADAFIAPKPECGHEELILNETNYQWECENAEHELILE
jgi:hypothetical protein